MLKRFIKLAEGMFLVFDSESFYKAASEVGETDGLKPHQYRIINRPRNYPSVVALTITPETIGHHQYTMEARVCHANKLLATLEEHV